MINQSMNEIQNRIKSIVKNVIGIKPIGNHDLKRHLVYLVQTIENKYVIKFYYVLNRWNREVASLKLLNKTDVLVPNIIDYGKFDNVEWILYEYVEGVILDKIYEEIPQCSLIDIYYKAGEQLGLIHSFKQFEYYGSMNEDLKFVNGFKSFRDYFETEVNRVFTNLEKYKHGEMKLINQAKKSLGDNLNRLDDVDQTRLCHNDFDARNLIVSKEKGVYKLKCVIDFEQSVISDADRELVLFYYKLLEENKPLSQAFKRGYEKHLAIDEDRLLRKRFIYRLYRGLSICSWAKIVDKDHYNEGIEILKEALGNNCSENHGISSKSL